MQPSNKTIFKNEIMELLPKCSWLAAGISERRHGNLRLGPRGEPLDALARARFALELAIPPERVIAPQLVHGSAVQIVTEKDFEISCEADGLVTGERNLFLSVTVADCLTLYFVDEKQEVVGLAHAGWRGLLRGVIQETVAKIETLGGRNDDTSVAIGPSIHECHFEVGLPVARQFEKHLGADVVSRRAGSCFVDLQKSAVRILGRAGIPLSNIRASPVCTFCEERYFSHRRDGEQGIGIEAMMAVIGMRG